MFGVEIKLTYPDIFINDIKIDVSNFTASEIKEVLTDISMNISKTIANIKIITDIPIFNTNDETEIAIKSNLKVGQVYKKGWNEIYKTIGLKFLGINNLKGGKQKIKARNHLLQYADFSFVEDGKRALQCIDIYEIPHYIEEKTDNRGKSGAYINKTIPIAINCLINKNRKILTTNINQISKDIGLVNEKFKNIDNEKLKEVNAKFTSAMINQMYYRCKIQQEDIVYRTLDRLQNDFSVLNYYKNFLIITNDNTKFISTKEDDILIRKAQRKILNEFNASRLMTIFQRGQQKMYYSSVCEYINKHYYKNWKKYYQQIQIYVDYEEFQKLIKNDDSVLDTRYINQLKTDLNILFADRIRNKTINDFNNTNDKADILSSDIKEYVELGIYTKEEVINKSKPFKYHDNYLEIQNSLIDYLIINEIPY